MKKNKLIVIINWGLLFAIPIMLLTVNVNNNIIDLEVSPKKLSTSLMNNTEKNRIIEDKREIVNEEKVELIINDSLVTVIKQQADIVIEEQAKQEVLEESTEVLKEEQNDVIKSYTGKMSFYSANCRGCSGLTSTGTDISDGKLYYQDNQYGNVRIIAAGVEIKKWSIVRLKNTSLGDNILAIVLDRGGAIGEGRTFLIDMLTNSIENKDGVENNIIVEVVRDGK